MQKQVGSAFSRKTYNVFLTNAQLLFVRITKKDYKAAEKALNDKVAGKSFKERLSILASNHYDIPSRYHTMTLDEMLKEEPDNFSIPHKEVVKISVKRPKFRDNKGLSKQDYLVVKTVN